MIGQLTGQITYQEDRFVILNVGGVGYKVFVSSETLNKLPVTAQTVTIWTKLIVREEVLDLYGFIAKKELNFFELLNSISGVGPKSALSILSLAPPETLQKAISSGKTEYLTQVSGIGRKIAEKIILELRDKIGHLAESSTNLDQEAEAVLALEALGYSNREAREALREIPSDITDTSAKIKEALKNLRN